MSPETAALFEQYVIPNYKRFPLSLVRGEGSWVWDDQGRRYLDFFPGWGCNLLGHCPPAIVKAVQEQVAEHLREYLADLQDELAWEGLLERTKPQLKAAARRAKQEIAQGTAQPMDYSTSGGS